MALADDVTSLENALATVRSTTYKPAEIVQLLDTALLNPIVEAGEVYASYTIGGRSITLNQDTALKMREYYDKIAKRDAANGGIVPTYAQFKGPT